MDGRVTALTSFTQWSEIEQFVAEETVHVAEHAELSKNESLRRSAKLYSAPVCSSSLP